MCVHIVCTVCIWQRFLAEVNRDGHMLIGTCSRLELAIRMVKRILSSLFNAGGLSDGNEGYILNQSWAFNRGLSACPDNKVHCIDRPPFSVLYLHQCVHHTDSNLCPAIPCPPHSARLCPSVFRTYFGDVERQASIDSTL